jgi:hypothetical protein
MIGRSREYQEAVRQFSARHPELPICIRATAVQIESDSFATDILALLDELNCSPERVVLVLDFASMGGLKPHEVEAFTEVSTERVYFALGLAPWLKIVAAFTSFPPVIKMKPGEVKLFPRTDWAAYRCLVER